MNIENLKALVYGRELTPYQRALALSEFSKVVELIKEREAIDTAVTHYDKSEQLKCELDRWYYSCKLYNINKGCKNCEHYKNRGQRNEKVTDINE